jgi:hypothetical protein
MSRTQSRLDCDTPYTDGKLFLPIKPGQLTTGSGTATWTRTGLGLVGTVVTAAAVVDVTLDEALFRTGVQDFLQEQFGSLHAGGANGLPVPGVITFTTGALVAGAVSIPVVSSAGYSVGQHLTLDTAASTVQEFPVVTAITNGTTLAVTALKNAHSSDVIVSGNAFTTPAGVSGLPPYAGSTELSPVTAPRPKGIQITGVAPIWTPGSTVPTVNSIAVTQTVFTNGAAPTVNTLLAATNLSLAGSTTPLIQNVQLTTPAFITAPFSEIVLEWDFTTGASSTLWGIYLSVTYNYN